MKRTILYAILGTVIFAVVAGVIAWWSQLSAPPDEEMLSAVVERGTVRVDVSANGSVQPRARVSLAFEVPGRVAEVLVDVGDSVEAGDVLARLHSEHLALQVRQAGAALASAEARLAQLQVGARPEAVAVAEAGLRAVEAQEGAAAANLDQLKAGASDAEIAAAEAGLASAMAQYKSAEDMHDMTMECFNIDLPYGQGQKEICPLLGPAEEQARYGLAAADSALAAAQARLDEALAGTDANQIRAAQANVSAVAAQRDAAQAQLDLLIAGASENQIAAAAALVAQAEAALDMAQLMLARATLYAPFDGVVSAVNVTEGQMTGSGLPAITLVDNSRFHVDVLVDELDVAGLADGQPVEVTLDALPDVVLSGSVERIAPAAARSPSMDVAALASMSTAGLASMGTQIAAPGAASYDVTIALDETSAPLRAGMSATTIATTRELADVLLIPSWVVRIDRDTGQTYVQRRVGEQTERVDVRLGLRGHGVVQVLAGLEEGDVVVLIQESVIEAIREAGP